MKIRTECPRNNKYYIRIPQGGYNGAVYGQPTQPYANVLDNCVGYANGRFNEIGGYGKCKYQLVCDAEDFIEAAKRMGLKISSTPIEGGIMVWQKGATLSSSDGAGHVAVVERVYDDGTIMTSESGWNSWAFKTVRRDNNNGRWGQNSAYRFRGCIINPAVKDPKVVPVPPLNVDGIGGACTVRAMQRFFGTLQDGVLSGQNRDCAKYYPALKAVEYGKGGSTCVKKLQKWLGITQDGVWGEKTSKALQKKLGVDADGIFGTNSMKAWQKYLNEHDKATSESKPSTPSVEPDREKKIYNFIDVSDWQGEIDWKKVKDDGIDGAIIRYADGNTLDKRFDENMKKAKAAGLHIGCYIFSRAKTKAEGQAEAERLYKAAKKYKPDMPYYIDLEVGGLSKYANTIAAAFLNTMTSYGVRGGVYANLNWWNNYLAKTANNYSSSAFWIAQYNDTMDYKPASLMGMWQYTSSGKVSGISGKVDRDKCYIAYWDIKKTWVERANAWARKIADDLYHYVTWKTKVLETHTCPICTGRKYDNYYGWNCIGFAFAVWHHGGGIPCKCNCHVISNEVGEKIANAKTDAEALKIAQNHVGIKDIKVIRNNGKDVPKSQWKAGDIGMKFDGKTYKHTFYYMGNGKVADSSNYSNDAKDIAIRAYDNYTARAIIRYTGK